MGPDKHKAIFGDLKKSCDIKLYFDTSLFMDIIKFYIYVPHCERPAISWDRAPQGAQWSGPWTWCRRESSQTRWHHVTTDLSVATASWSFQEELWSNSHWHRGSPNCPRILMNKKDFIRYVVHLEGFQIVQDSWLTKRILLCMLYIGLLKLPLCNTLILLEELSVHCGLSFFVEIKTESTIQTNSVGGLWHYFSERVFFLYC